MQGIVQSVQTHQGGGYPIEDTPAGSPTLTFGNAADFDPDGGVVDIDGVELAYNWVDLDLDVMTLAEPLAFAVAEDDFVATVPITGDTYATVALGDDIVTAEVPHYLRALLEDGERSPGEGEAVILQEITPGTHRVMDVSGQPPAIDGRFAYNIGEALLASKKMLGEALAENEQAITDAQGELSTAHQRINDAFGEIDLKPDQAYVDAAKQQAIDAAEVEARRARDAAIEVANSKTATIYSDTPPEGTSVVDNGDGTFTVTGPGAVDNGDGTFTLDSPYAVDNGDGTFTLDPPAGGFPLTAQWMDGDERLHRWDGEQWVTVQDPAALADAARSQAVDAAQTALTQAETDLAAAIASGDAAAIADAEAKIATAKAQAIDAAADDAAAKASAAQTAAEQTAQAALTQAQTDLQQAIASGDAAAIADAEAKIATAKQEAITAAEADATAKAAEAMQKANDALSTAESALALADGAVTTHYLPNPPWADNTTQPDDVLGDIWFDTDDGSAYRWTGTAWVLIGDAALAEALDAAQNAQTTADGKITAYYLDTEPLEAGEGDLWFDTDNNSKIHRRTGGAWVALLDPKALADAAEQAAKTAAAADATAKAEAAEAAAIQAAATDAQTKADAAEAAAEAAAKTYADTVASGASQSAIDAAAADAQAKADAAKQAAIDAAALDATAKAEAAEAAAAATAAADATAKADAAEAAAEQAAASYTDENQSGVNLYDGGATVRTTSRFIEYHVYEALKGHVGRTVTFSIEMKPTEARKINVYPYQGAGISIEDSFHLDPVDTEWARYVFTTTVKQWSTVPPPVESHTWGGIGFYDPAGSQAQIQYRNFKIELGSRDTGFTESPDDRATAKADAAEQAAKAYTITMTDGLAKQVESTALPGTTVMPKDSVWRVVDASGNYSAVFVQTASPTGSTWQARAITSEVIDNMDAGKLTVSGETVLNQAVANEFAARLANIIQANIGNLTVTGDTHLEEVVAQVIAGDTASFMQLTVDQILAGFLQAQWIITEEGSIVAGDPSGARVEITSDGVRVFVVSPNGAPYEAVSMVNSEISFGVIGQDGTRLGGIASDGSVAGTSGSFSKDVRIKGLPVVGQLGGGILPGWLDNLPRGVININQRWKKTVQHATGFEFTYLHVSAMLYPGRRYRIVARARVHLASSPDSIAYMRIRHAQGTARPTELTSEMIGPLDIAGTLGNSGSRRVDLDHEVFFEVPTEQPHSFISTITGEYGGEPTAEAGMIYVEDVGPTTPQMADADEDNVLYQSTWQATASRMYDKTGATMAGRDGDIATWFWHIEPKVAEGAAWIYGAGATESTHSTELGKTLPQAFLGATLHKVEVYLRNKVWYQDGVSSGDISINTLSASSLPSTKLIEGSRWIDDISEGEGIWIEVPASWFTNGANQGMTMGDKDGQALDNINELRDLTSGEFHGADDSDPPLLRVTYSR